MLKLLVICSLLFSGLAQAQNLGVGAYIGNPLGVSAKYWRDNGHAIDGAIGMSWGKHSNLSIHSDYLLQSDGAFILNDTQPLDLYYGIGGRFEFADDIEVGLRVPVGLAHRLDNNASDIFAEIAPVFDFITTQGIELHFGFGARYYF